ncbi:MAG: hypothetical protein IJ512_01880 [Ruminococcus sp.]|nr:hypothetical protein [Ruminococcus sp.]
MIRINKWFPEEMAEKYAETMAKKIMKKICENDSVYRSIRPEIRKAVFEDDNGEVSKPRLKRFLSVPLHELQEDKEFKDFFEAYKEGRYASDGIAEIINYSMLSDDLRHNLLASLNVSVCPYCNRQYITTWEKTADEKRTTADLDHFYPKSQYPLYALCLFNFIPSCHICNSLMKGAKTDEAVYPYAENFGDDAYFTVNGDKEDKAYCRNLLRIWRGEKDAPISVRIYVNPAADPEKKKRIDNSVRIFHLNEVYQSHEAYVRELLVKKRIYGEGAYSDTMEALFKKIELPYTACELERFLYGFCWMEGEDPERALSKLTYDIVKR